MKIAVLMTCFNRIATTLRCLDSLFKQAMPEECSLDVWLVDDCSPDRTGAIVKVSYPKVNVIQTEGNLFWCKGMRRAWDKAAEAYDYDFYLWLNDDVILKKDSIAIALRDYEKLGKEKSLSVLVGSFSSDSTENDVSYSATLPNGSRLFPDGRMPHLANGYLNGNFVLIPRGVFKKVGPIYGKYHHAFGDYDYSMMLRRAKIDFYSTSNFLGVCPQQPQRYQHLKGKNTFQRIKLLFQPKGYSLHDTFLYRFRNWGLLRALFACAHVLFIVLFKDRKYYR